MTETQRHTPGRNEPCYCGSGKKYKKCCMRGDEQAERKARYREEHWEDETWEQLPEEETAESELMDDEPVPEWPPEQTYPQPPELPEPDETMQAFVDAWWKPFMPRYRDRDADALTAILTRTLNEHPEAIPFLALDEEALLEYQAIMIRAGRRAELVDLLLRFRTEAPTVYDQVHGYLDTTLAVLLIALGRAGEIAGILDRFQKYPDAEPNNLADMLDILLVANRQDEVFALARDTALPCACSSNVMGLGPSLHWLIVEAAIPSYDRHGYSEQDVADFVAAYDSVDAPFPPHTMTRRQAREHLAAMFAPMDWAVPDRRGPRDDFLNRLSATFWVWLHDTHGISWAPAEFFSNRLRDLLFLAPPEHMTFRDPLSPCTEAIEQFMFQNCKRMFHFSGLHAFTLLQALHWFADFLEDHGQGTASAHEQLRETCRTFGAKLLSNINPCDDGFILFPTFPDYPYADSAIAGQKKPTTRTGKGRDLDELEEELG